MKPFNTLPTKTTKSSAFVVCLNILDCLLTISVDPDQTAPVGAD